MAVCCILMHFIPLIGCLLVGRGKPSARVVLTSFEVMNASRCGAMSRWASMSRCVLDDGDIMWYHYSSHVPREPGGSSQTKLLCCCIHVHIFSLKENHEPYTNRFKPIKAFRLPSTPNDFWWAWPKSISRKHQLQALPFAQKPPKPVAFSGRPTGAVEGKVNNDTNNNR